MQIGMIGLGKMGGNMATRLVRHGHEVFGFDFSEASVAKAKDNGVTPVGGLDELCGRFSGRKAIWMMVPAGDPVDQTIASLRPHLGKDDVIIDGGNSLYKDTVRRGKELAEAGIAYVDVGTSGGIWGITEGYSMMVGGADEPVGYLKPALEALAPAPDKGWGHVGKSGAGHYVKMVHNGIEYGMMQAYAEGMGILKKVDYELDLAQVAHIWRHGSVVRSWLLDLLADALDEDMELSEVAPYVPDSGEGRWTVFEAIDLDVPAPTITLSLFERFRSRDEYAYYDRVLAALRNKFGGHAIKKHED